MIVLGCCAIAACNSQPIVNTTVDNEPQNAVYQVDQSIYEIEMPATWKAVKNYTRYHAAQSQQSDSIIQSRLRECINLWKAPRVTRKNDLKYNLCLSTIVDAAIADRKDIPLEVLLTWANSADDLLYFVPPRAGTDGFFPEGYVLPSGAGVLSYWYAVNYDHLSLKKAERDRIDTYLTQKLMEQSFPPLDGKHRTPCDLARPWKTTLATAANSCGSIRWKVALGELALGLKLANKDLFDKGIDDLVFNLSMIDQEGIFVTYAAKGGKAFGYYKDGLQFMSHYVELFKTLNFDFLEYRLPHGRTVKEYFDKTYEILRADFHLMDRYARINKGAGSYPFEKVKNLSHSEFISKTNTENTVFNWQDNDSSFYMLAPEYVERYRSDLKVKPLYTNTGNGGFFGAYVYAIHQGNR